MKTFTYFLVCFLFFKGIAQNKPKLYFNESGEEIIKHQFFKARDHTKNIAVYIENDSISYGLLINRYVTGKLDKETFKTFKEYLDVINETKVDDTQNIIINYLSSSENNGGNKNKKARWEIFDTDYIRKLKKRKNTTPLWINASKVNNLEYFHKNKINWITDKDNVLQKLFFYYETSSNYLLIKPDGTYFFCLGEHTKKEVLEVSKQFFK